MPLWKVSLKDPLSREKILCSGKIEADTEYGAKRNYFNSLYKEIPTLAQTPFSAILPHMTTRKLETAKPKTSEFPPENFFIQIKAKYGETLIEEELENSPYLPKLIKFVTEESLRIERIPKECPICGNPGEKLVIHHWNSSKEKNKNKAIINGYYRRMCISCNSSLGILFKNPYPLPWKLQYKKLLGYSKKFPKTYQNMKEEGEWSLLLEEEWNRVKYIWDTTPRRMLISYLSNQTEEEI